MKKENHTKLTFLDWPLKLGFPQYLAKFQKLPEKDLLMLKFCKITALHLVVLWKILVKELRKLMTVNFFGASVDDCFCVLESDFVNTPKIVFRPNQHLPNKSNKIRNNFSENCIVRLFEHTVQYKAFLCSLNKRGADFTSWTKKPSVLPT